MKIAIITGASSGMGREFVYALDKRQLFDEIWTVARRRERLDELSENTRAKIRPLALDLTDDASVDEIAGLLDAEKPEVAALVNASGFGLFTEFTASPAQAQLDMVTLNDRALTSLTWRVLPYMKSGGEIFNLGSLSAFQPVPYMAVYAASKAYVLSFSRALNAELKPRGIRVMAVCPGWVRTEFFDRAKRDDTITYFNRYYDAADVVKRALRDMKRGRDVSVCGFPVRTQVRLVKLFPHGFVMRVWLRQQGKK